MVFGQIVAAIMILSVPVGGLIFTVVTKNRTLSKLK